ncbi:hypothetical protein Pla108_02290 [Botrimarina colliarenosi]|uniref:Uncharacterized protein n=1 Tax=Botrimarina colliarenosi TaxID=2528001 RepID=A0A5C6AH23_9BACT|nr:hypothetical protein [Botrimarina colliarenosi]TWT99294.1 hypothetical protein Pla108_02290 [Botrimarina colliarenosi]
MSSCAPLTQSVSKTTTLQPVLERLGGGRHERRGIDRREFSFRLLLTPLDTPRDGGVEGRDAGGSSSIYVTGRNLSLRGVGIEHATPITHRRVRLQAADSRLDELGLGDLEFDVTLRWCRFVSPESYESGGQVTSPLPQQLLAASKA